MKQLCYSPSLWCCFIGTSNDFGLPIGFFVLLQIILFYFCVIYPNGATNQQASTEFIDGMGGFMNERDLKGDGIVSVSRC